MSIHHQIAAHESWAKTTDRAARTRAARQGLEAKFEREADPDGVMSPADRAKAVANARSAYYLRLARSSAEARRQRMSTK
ncbi:hypothetical protein ACIA49_03495 [Kribbella sp. NPDC051587]|uniref:hypothetical protein n=1 Tax=Kribbella sp. NPDC051587 TaxID=3364119 RepID=UPI0037B1FA76